MSVSLQPEPEKGVPVRIFDVYEKVRHAADSSRDSEPPPQTAVKPPDFREPAIASRCTKGDAQRWYPGVDHNTAVRMHQNA